MNLSIKIENCKIKICKGFPFKRVQTLVYHSEGLGLGLGLDIHQNLLPITKENGAK